MITLKTHRATAPYAVILAGGLGARFWPLSTTACPKPFCALIERDTCLLEATWQRIPSWIPLERRLIVIDIRQRERIEALCPGIFLENILAEPYGCNTAAAVATATAWVARKDPEATLAFLPADHLIAPPEAFHDALAQACNAASHSATLVLMGIPPTRPETGYGYIEPEHPAGAPNTPLPVKRFLEKPSKAKAQKYFKDGTFFWNSGILIAQASTLEDQIAQQLPKHHQLMSGIKALKDPKKLPELLDEHYPSLPKISIDNGVLETAKNTQVLPAPFSWSDLGDWTSLSQNYDHDALGNTILGEGVFKSSKNSFLYNTQNNHSVVALGLENCLVIHTPTATLICAKDQAQAVRDAARS